MLTEGPSVQTQQTQVTLCTPCSTTRVCKGLIIEWNILLLSYNSHPRLVVNRVDPDQTPYPTAPDLGPHWLPRPVCPNRTDPCHAMHTLQHNQDLNCSEYKIKYITTCKHFTSQMSSKQGSPWSNAVSSSVWSRSTLFTKSRSCHAQQAA